MDMYTENNGGFQTFEGTVPFEEGYQVQGEESFVAGTYQETVAEPAYYEGEYDAESLPGEQYQETAAEYETEACTEETEQAAEPEAVEAEQKQDEEFANMSAEDIVRKSMERVRIDTEKLTRRSMKECVAEYVQTLCLEDVEFARMTMDPRKSMAQCFQYINQQAWDYVQDEMKANDVKPGIGRQGYGSDIPDDLCYQWAEDYFRKPLEKEDEKKIIPKSSTGKSDSKPAAKKKAGNKEKKSRIPEKKPEQKNAEIIQVAGQLSLLDMLPQGNQAS